MTRLLTNGLKRLSLASLALGLLLVPTLSRADQPQPDLRMPSLTLSEPQLDLRAGSGAPAKSLISPPSLGARIGGIDYAVLLGLEIPPNSANVGPRISGEVMYGLMDLAPQLRLDIGGRVAFGYHGFDGGSEWLLDFTPAAKLLYAINDQFAVHGLFGLGLGFAHTSIDAFQGFGGGSDTSAFFDIQFGLGGAYAITPTINLLGEVLFDVVTKSGAGVFIAIPQVGIQFH